MKDIRIADVTLKEFGKDSEQISFREKVETAKLLYKMGVNVIETAKIANLKTDTLFLHTIAPLVGETVIACPVGLSEEELKATVKALGCAKRARLQVSVPTSTVQMEYICHMKPKALIEALEKQLKLAASLCDDVEFSAEDATRSETEFLSAAVKTAISCGVKTVTLCDSAGVMLPDEFSALLKDLYAAVPELKSITLSVECSDKLALGVAAALAAISAGAGQVKASVARGDSVSLLSIGEVLRIKGDSVGIKATLNHSVLAHSVRMLEETLNGKRSATTPFDYGVAPVSESFTIGKEDDINTVSKYILSLGYELSEEDIAKVYERVQRLTTTKNIGAKELDAAVASSALQVTPTYKLISYVINSGNVMIPTAAIVLEKDGESLRGISFGDGPVDAAFLALEKITGRHYELDDYQIQPVTEGREAVADALVKLRASGKLYSGRGISTDVIGASIRAYLNALNKICFENS